MRKAAVLAVCVFVSVWGLAQQPSNNSQSTSPQTQSASPAANPSPETAQRPSAGNGDVPANTEMRATLDTPLSSKTSKAGDRFTATISQPVTGRNGVVVPAGARVEGEVSEAEDGKLPSSLHGRGTLNLRLRDIVLPNGQTIPLVATLVSVHSTNGKTTQRADNEGQLESGIQGKSIAKDVGIGGGFVFGGPLKGLAVGTLSGGGYVLSTSGKDVNLPAQTGMVIRLDQDVSVP